MHLPVNLPQWLKLLSVLGGGSVADHSLFLFAPIVCGDSLFGP